jgi:hypothetical protein
LAGSGTEEQLWSPRDEGKEKRGAWRRNFSRKRGGDGSLLASPTHGSRLLLVIAGEKREEKWSWLGHVAKEEGV